jgi:hypothetical protein
MKYPDAAALATAAYTASGAKTHSEFVDKFMHGAVGIRSFRRWIAGEGPPEALAELVLHNVSTGWVPKPRKWLRGDEGRL